MLGADVRMAQLARLVKSQLQHPFGPRREADLALGRVLPLPDHLLHLGSNRVQADVHALQRPGGHAFALRRQPEENVLGADHVVTEPPGLLLR